ncbi:MAG TPA: hypothetical protein VNH18_27290 [Bryobacteraceae bacterium]|nr:hypothetical protein [Bryobacteraceae bacterium]
MGFAVWIDSTKGLAWAQGTHEYRVMGTAVIAASGQFHHRDFNHSRRRPAELEKNFGGFFGSLEEVNATLRTTACWNLRWTPGHLR